MGQPPFSLRIFVAYGDSDGQRIVERFNRIDGSRVPVTVHR